MATKGLVSFIAVAYDSSSTATAVSDVTGLVGLPVTFTRSGPADYDVWTWSSVPGSSAIANAVIPFPDNGVSTPIDMTDCAGLWHFDGNADDTSGGGHNGTVNGATLATGQIGQCYDFDGTNDYIEVPHSTDLDATTALSISAWIYLDDYGAWSGIVTKGINTANYSLQLSSTGSGQLQFFTGGSPWNKLVRSSSALGLSTWRHVVATWDNGVVKLYVDGDLDTVEIVTWSITPNTEALTFGSDYPGNDEYFNGKIDEVAVWTRVISAREVKQIYLAQSAAVAGLGSALTFTPDAIGTYSVSLAAGSGVADTADAVVSVPADGANLSPAQLSPANTAPAALSPSALSPT